ncbi:SDR family NAD(P)-dependent oxidoreductase [Gluconacetobacter tumulisoli]|uniref:SDR family oxidoreductase n=1 Tax=Gluconacetobacter tumulisoli TaxID=1286189 RepID=A0A7W4PJU9_9PROT|nr:SDR family oxidoreductase [Gluconacetobacter tumulisoli]MBB2200737.1 SDR family oxidoreductase [Gluconacetobacter tumulisoli]
MGRLAGKTAIVIGGAQGIGAAIVTRFVREGASVVIGDWDEAPAQALAARLGVPGAVHVVRTDVSSREATERLVRETVERFGRVDILVQNAGIFPWTLLEDTSEQEWDQVLSVNLKGCFLSLKACLPIMKRQQAGRIIFMSSVTGPRVSSAGHGHYGASKAGIVGLIRGACMELAPYGITVNGVEPGNILTDAMQRTRSADFIAGMERSVPLGRLGTPDDIAGACLFLASDDAAYVSGTTIVVDGGQTVCEAKP